MSSVNEFVIRFANVNGTGSASANGIFAKSIFRMGIPISPKNIFPSNIQGLPTWYEVRVSEKGYLGRRDGIDILVGVNPQTYIQDIESVVTGGYFIYDNSKPMHESFFREDIHFIGIPMMKLSMQHFADPRKQQLFKNIIYVGAVAALIAMPLTAVQETIEKLFAAKPKLIPPNFEALQIGFDYAVKHYSCPLEYRVQKADKTGDSIVIDGNTATALGLIYGGATVAAWYPITPSTSLASAFEKYCKKLRVDPETGKNNFAVVQAEDELSAIGMVIGATWNGARSFTATSGAGVSLMNEFIGLAYFAEIPVTLINVQRGGPSTGMPTRTQQADILSSAYASHGDTKHVLLFPSTPNECFHFGALALDLADRLQTPVIILSDLDLGMNEHMTDPFIWDEQKQYDRGKVLNAKEMDEIKDWGRYLDIDGDGIPYRTIPGTHPTKGSYFTRGTSHDEYAKYSEAGDAYVRKVDRLLRKFETAKEYVPKPAMRQAKEKTDIGILFFGTTRYAALESLDILNEEGIYLNAMRIKAFPFNHEVRQFLDDHQKIYVIEQNRDAQMRSLLINELDYDPGKLESVLNYDGTPITADLISQKIRHSLNVKQQQSQPI
ncbi:2-oxoacid:acceptor oxidoreductase subunit alpha [Portibacter marinus]|uniref:2-oxoacid:acceptor oxidoreductase subunit alpha n=1 Tax=Portibacter marinus TaxID=2898660 RepID=UPI001F2EDB87|nr:2-oxoacid:acceptor oxidoreductase subunit alpha [Portibacter marinus]